MVLPGKLIKMLRMAMKTRKYLVVVHWIGKDNKLGTGYKAANFPLAVVDRAFQESQELFWKQHKEERVDVAADIPSPVSKDGRIPLYQAAKTVVTKKGE
jgi:hypothetical protein